MIARTPLSKLKKRTLHRHAHHIPCATCRKRKCPGFLYRNRDLFTRRPLWDHRPQRRDLFCFLRLTCFAFSDAHPANRDYVLYTHQFSEQLLFLFPWLSTNLSKASFIRQSRQNHVLSQCCTMVPPPSLCVNSGSCGSGFLPSDLSDSGFSRLFHRCFFIESVFGSLICWITFRLYSILHFP